MEVVKIHRQNKAIANFGRQAIASSKKNYSSNIMTHPIYTRQQLQFLSLKELRMIATQLGIEPADKRSKASHITSIVERNLPRLIDGCERFP